MTVLAPTDFSEQSNASVRVASRLAVRRDTDLILLHCLESAVADPPWRHLLEVPDDMRARLWRAARRRLETFYETHVPATEQPREVEYRVALEFAEDGIQSAIGKTSCRLVVMGATGKGRFTRALLGSTTERVVRASSTPVLVVPEEEATTFEHIVAPVDLTDRNRQSLETAVEFTREHAARLMILHAYQPPASEMSFFSAHVSPETMEAVEASKRNELRTFVDRLDTAGIDYTEQLRVGSPYRVIADLVDESDVDLLVMGTHGRRGLERLFLGSTTTKVLRRLPCPVLTRRSETRSNR